jgi:hypothetical protein
VTTYAAIQVDLKTIIEMLAHVSEVPDGKSRLVWALFTFNYDKEEDYFFIGGNYLNMDGPPNYKLQIVSRKQLNEWFEYNEKPLNRSCRPKDTGSWFPVKVKNGLIFRGPRAKKEELSALWKGSC